MFCAPNCGLPDSIMRPSQPVPGAAIRISPICFPPLQCGSHWYFAMRITTLTNIVDHFYLEGGRNNADLTNIADLTNNADQVGMWIAWKYGSKHNADQLGIRISFHIAYQLGMWISTQCGPAWLCLFFGLCPRSRLLVQPPTPPPRPTTLPSPPKKPKK